MDILSQWQSSLMKSLDPLGERPGVLHSFSENESGAERAIEHNFAIGISGPVTFKNASGLRAVIEKTNMNSLLAETDAPFLTPHPHRGKRNEPAYVRYVAEKIGEVKDTEVERTTEILNENAKRLFHW
jgi:TatD DNase family protein